MKKFLKSASTSRLNGAAKKGALFGVPLSTVMQKQAQSGTTLPVPRLVVDCIAYLREHGMDQEGIFRVSGGKRQLEEIVDMYNAGHRVDLDLYKDPNVIAGVLKQYLRELPDSLIPPEVTERLEADAGGDLKRMHVTHLRRLVISVPPHARQLLEHLVRFLADLERNASKTKMNAENLSIVFGPNLLKSSEDGLGDMLPGVTITKLLIGKCKNVFCTEDEWLKDHAPVHPIPLISSPRSAPLSPRDPPETHLNSLSAPSSPPTSPKPERSGSIFARATSPPPVPSRSLGVAGGKRLYRTKSQERINQINSTNNNGTAGAPVPSRPQGPGPATDSDENSDPATTPTPSKSIRMGLGRLVGKSSASPAEPATATDGAAATTPDAPSNKRKDSRERKEPKDASGRDSKKDSKDSSKDKDSKAAKEAKEAAKEAAKQEREREKAEKKAEKAEKTKGLVNPAWMADDTQTIRAELLREQTLRHAAEAKVSFLEAQVLELQTLCRQLQKRVEKTAM